jgi:hypothetical protein
MKLLWRRSKGRRAEIQTQKSGPLSARNLGANQKRAVKPTLIEVSSLMALTRYDAALVGTGSMKNSEAMNRTITKELHAIRGGALEEKN